MRYSCFIEDRVLTVHSATVSKIPYNTVWPGKQRPLDQTEDAYFVYFDMTEPVRLKVEVSECDIERFDIRPLSFDIPVKREGNSLILTISKPMNFSLEINGYHHALHVFANPKDDFIPDENTIYFGPGEHDAGIISPKAGQTVYIAEGAVVYGGIYIFKQDHVTVRGRGVIDSSRLLRGQQYDKEHYVIKTLKSFGLSDWDATRMSCFGAYNSNDLKVEGIIFKDAPSWVFTTRNGCRRVEIDNIKLIGQWRYNADGIDLCTTSDAVVKNCFIRSFDDSIVVRAPQLDGEAELGGCENIEIYNNVLWCDWGKNLEIWNGKNDSLIKNVYIHDNYCTHTAHYAISIDTWYGSEKINVEDVTYENIYIDTHTEPMYPVYQKDLDAPYSPVIRENPTVAVYLGATKLGRDIGNQMCDPDSDISSFKVKYKNIRFKNVICSNSEVLLPIDIRSHGISLEDITFEDCDLK